MRTKEEISIYGATVLGDVFDGLDASVYLEDVLKRKGQDIAQFGLDELLRNGDLEVVRDLARFGGIYFQLLASPRLNDFVNSVLNEKAVVHSFNAIITRPEQKSEMLGYQFHRDQPFFKDTRTSIIVMIPLVDYGEENGSTEYVPGTHLFERMPSSEFMERHKVATCGGAGEAFALDSVLWHRAGRNRSDGVRPLIAIKYTLAPFKQQVDFCESAKDLLAEAPEIVRARLGWNARVCLNFEEFRVPGNRRKFKSGQYDMTNTRIGDQ